MSDFGSWLEKLTAELKENPQVQERAYFQKETPIEDCIEDDDEIFVEGGTEDFYEHCEYSYINRCWEAPCRVCGKDHDIRCEPGEFDYDMHYCGGSPSCCP